MSKHAMQTLPNSSNSPLELDLHREIASKIVQRIKDSSLPKHIKSKADDLQETYEEISLRCWFRMNRLLGGFEINAFIENPVLYERSLIYLERYHPELLNNSFVLSVEKGKYTDELDAAVDESVLETLIDEGALTVNDLIEDTDLAQLVDQYLTSRYPEIGSSHTFLNRVKEGDLSKELDELIDQ